jgi:site-specific DNA-methyltransferase (adenine-specific)
MFVDIYETENKYSIIYADPPWRYQDRTCSGAAEEQYPTMKIDDIAALPVSRVAADDCVLFMWATYPLLPDALRLIEAWGFTYKTIGFQWLKKNRSGKGWFFGLGRWTRGNTEPCLIATKGKPKRASASVAQIIEYPLGRHSAKPPIVREKIMELMGGGSSLEIFARQAAAGWDCWGNEAPTEQAAFMPRVREQETGQQSLFEYIRAEG